MSDINNLTGQFFKKEVLQHQTKKIEENLDEQNQEELQENKAEQDITNTNKEEFQERGNELLNAQNYIAMQRRVAVRRTARKVTTSTPKETPKVINTTNRVAVNTRRRLATTLSPLPSVQSVNTPKIENIDGTFYADGELANGLIGDRYYEYGQLANGDIEGIVYEYGIAFTDVAQTAMENIQKVITAAIKIDDNFNSFMKSDSEETSFTGSLSFNIGEKVGSANITIDKLGNVLEIKDGILTEYSNENKEELQSQEIFSIDENGVWTYTSEKYGLDFANNQTCLSSFNATNAPNTEEFASVNNAKSFNSASTVRATVNSQTLPKSNIEDTIKNQINNKIHSLSNTIDSTKNNYSAKQENKINELKGNISGLISYGEGIINAYDNINEILSLSSSSYERNITTNKYNNRQPINLNLRDRNNNKIEYNAEITVNGQYCETIRFTIPNYAIITLSKNNGRNESIQVDRWIDSSCVEVAKRVLNRDVKQESYSYNSINKDNKLVPTKWINIYGDNISATDNSKIPNIRIENNEFLDGCYKNQYLEVYENRQEGYTEYTTKYNRFPENATDAINTGVLQDINLNKTYQLVLWTSKEKIYKSIYTKNWNNKTFKVLDEKKIDFNTNNSYSYQIGLDVTDSTNVVYSGKEEEYTNIKGDTTLLETQYFSYKEKSTHNISKFICDKNNNRKIKTTEYYEELSILPVYKNNNQIDTKLQYHKKITNYNPVYNNGKLMGSTPNYAITTFGLDDSGYGKIVTKYDGTNEYRQVISVEGKPILTTHKDSALDNLKDGIVYNVDQGNIGDCYLLTTLWWLGKARIDLTKRYGNNPNPVITWNSDNSATVITYNKFGRQVPIRVTQYELNQQSFIDDNGNITKIKLLEGDKTAKAIEIALLRTIGPEVINKGDPLKVMQLLFGPDKYTRLEDRLPGQYSLDFLQTCSYIRLTEEMLIKSGAKYVKRTSADGEYLCAILTDPKTNSEIEIPAAHALGIESIDTNSTPPSVVLMNPWHSNEKIRVSLEWVMNNMSCRKVKIDPAELEKLKNMQAVLQHSQELFMYSQSEEEMYYEEELA